MTQKWHEIRSDSTKTATPTIPQTGETTPQTQPTEPKKDSDKQ